MIVFEYDCQVLFCRTGVSGIAVMIFQAIEADAKSDRKFYVSRDNQQGDA